MADPPPKRGRWDDSNGGNLGGDDAPAGRLVLTPAQPAQLVLTPAQPVLTPAQLQGSARAPVPAAAKATGVPLSWANGELQVWSSSCHGPVEFRAWIVMPSAGAPGAGRERGARVPLAIYFPGLGENPKVIEERLKDWRAIAPEPFILAAPFRPKRGWWFIDDNSALGWIQGAFQEEAVKRYCSWVFELSRRAGVDFKRVGIFGFSAGAYACAEILAAGCGVPLKGVGLGGVHGHGQWDLTGCPESCGQGARQKFDDFLRRLQEHQGYPWIEATHGTTDQECKWEDARRIFEALDRRQAKLGRPALSVRQLAPEQQDVTPNRKRNRTHHNYFAAAFLRADFLRALLGGAPPEPHKVDTPQWSSSKWWGGQGEKQWAEKESVKELSDWAPAKGVVLVSRDQAAAGDPPLSAAAPGDGGGGAGPQGSAPEFEWDAGPVSGRKPKWRKYAEEVQLQLAKAFLAQSGRGKADVKIEGWQYTVDFDSWIQVAQHSSFERKIRIAEA